MRVAFIGAGKVGFSLGRFLKSDRVIIAGYYSRHTESAREAAEFTDSKVFETIEELVNDSDVIFLTVPDGEIKNVYLQLCSFDIANKTICHCSGMLSSREAFSDIERYSAEGISMHPLFPVSDKLNSYRKMANAFFCLEGSDEKVKVWKDILEEKGARTRIINAEDKVKYHAACVMASNLVCALMQESVDTLSECGFSKEEALEAINPLVKANVEAIFEKGPVMALTGPVERADKKTIDEHMQQLRGNRRECYSRLSLKLTEMAKERHPERDYTEIRELLV